MPFLIWLSDSITNHFQNYFVVDDLPEHPSTVPLEFARALNRREEMSSDETGIAIDIAGKVFNSSSKYATNTLHLLLN